VDGLLSSMPPVSVERALFSCTQQGPPLPICVAHHHTLQQKCLGSSALPEGAPLNDLLSSNSTTASMQFTE
jgi:hypothetical protein